MESDDKEGVSSIHGAPRGSPSSVLFKKGCLELGVSVATGEGKSQASLKDGEKLDSHAFLTDESSSSPPSSSIGVKPALI